MRQVLFEIPYMHLKIFGYGFMLFLAFVAAMNLAAWRARRDRLDPEIVYDLALYVFVGGLLGARVFYVVQYWGVRVHSVADFVKFWEGGIVLYGSLIGATLAFVVYWWRRPFPFLALADCMAPAMALGIGIGRLGCFLNGCCYGDRCHMPWGVAFPGPQPGTTGSPPWADQVRGGLIPRDAAWSLPVHPTQVYSAIDGFVLLVLLLAFDPLKKRDGQTLALLLMTYPVTRFLIEWLRNDEGAVLLGMTISQVISVVLFACGLALWGWVSRRPAPLHRETAGTLEPATT